MRRTSNSRAGPTRLGPACQAGSRSFPSAPRREAHHRPLEPHLERARAPEGQVPGRVAQRHRARLEQRRPAAAAEAQARLDDAHAAERVAAHVLHLEHQVAAVRQHAVHHHGQVPGDVLGVPRQPDHRGRDQHQDQPERRQHDEPGDAAGRAARAGRAAPARPRPRPGRAARAPPPARVSTTPSWCAGGPSRGAAGRRAGRADRAVPWRSEGRAHGELDRAAAVPALGAPGQVEPHRREGEVEAPADAADVADVAGVRAAPARAAA